MSIPVSLKLDDHIFEDTNKIVKSLDTSRNQYINEALEYYNNLKKREKIKEQLKKELILIEHSSREVLEEMESLPDDL